MTGNTYSELLRIPIGEIILSGDLTIPEASKSLVIFSHGSGSSRFSPRNKQVAQQLQEKKFATLLFDLLTPEEDVIYSNRFNIELLTYRLIKVTEHISSIAALQHMSIGYFGASTGSASALKAAAKLGNKIKAVVSRGGRPDLALDVLSEVKAATLLIVGGLDTKVIELNLQAMKNLTCPYKLEIVEGASHLFEEPGKLTEVSNLALQWFSTYLL